MADRSVHSRLLLPLVSVVIPTHGRPRLVERAVRSALDQTFRKLEVIVVIDGPDSPTVEALSRITDARLDVLELRGNVGGSEARNIGVRYARAKWIAFLDDDDEWLPGKIELQHMAGEALAVRDTIVAGRFIERTENSERVLPRRLPLPGEPVGDYLFVRKGWNSGEGFLQTSTWFVTRALLLKVPFTAGLKRCQDLDWLLHAATLPDTKLLLVPEVVAIFHHEEHGIRVSRTPDWRFLYDWARLNRSYLSPGAYSFFMATFCVPSAAKQGAGPRTFIFLLRQCLLSGAVTGKCLLLFMICWALPESSRRSLRDLIGRARSAFHLKSTLIAHTPAPGKVV
jgi:glycosyltransferase involved in cell wall biosynthesis